MQEIRELSLPELREKMRELSEKPFRAEQIYSGLHERRCASCDEMSNLSLPLREKLRGHFRLFLPEPVRILSSSLDGTRKFIFRLEDGHIIESVFMRYRHGNTVCISSQVGCRMGCRFCASTLEGLARNLSAAEMLTQVYQIQRLLGERISNVVVMGSGEPLDNYENLTKFVRMISDERGLHLSQRNLTVSTCGLVPELLRLSEEGFQLTLALSLHAPKDEIRRRLMPIAARYPLSELLPAVRHYFERTGRRVSFEYSVVRDLNDTKEEAEALSTLLKKLRDGGEGSAGQQKGFPLHVNLIPVNPIRERSWERPERRRIEDFQHVLEKNGISATIRREMGADISGACGQLRRDYLGEISLYAIETEERRSANRRV